MDSWWRIPAFLAKFYVISATDPFVVPQVAAIQYLFVNLIASRCSLWIPWKSHMCTSSSQLMIVKCTSMTELVRRMRWTTVANLSASWRRVVDVGGRQVAAISLAAYLAVTRPVDGPNTAPVTCRMCRWMECPQTLEGTAPITRSSTSSLITACQRHLATVDALVIEISSAVADDDHHWLFVWYVVPAYEFLHCHQRILDMLQWCEFPYCDCRMMNQPEIGKVSEHDNFLKKLLVDKDALHR